MAIIVSPQVVKALRVKQVATAKLKPNPHNPRMLFDKNPLDVLRESIRRNGILVPLTVYRERISQNYVILDGQRRWICAQDVGLKTVPVNEVAEPSLVENIVTMFQIHKLREDWELMPTALKIELLMNEVNDKNNARLAELTGLDVAVVVRCKKLISYEKKYQDMMLDPDPEKRMKADFFIELYTVIHDRDIRKFSWLKRTVFIDSMISKYMLEPRSIRSVTDFRKIKQYITNARQASELSDFSRRLRRFTENQKVLLSYLEIGSAKAHAEAKSLVKRIEGLESQINDIDVEAYYGEENLWLALKRLMDLVASKLKQAGKRFVNQSLPKRSSSR